MASKEINIKPPEQRLLGMNFEMALVFRASGSLQDY